MRAAVLVLVGCGRLTFDPVGDGREPGDGFPTVDDAGNQIVPIAATAETFVDDAHTGFNYGAAQAVLCSPVAPTEVGLLAFDLASLGARQLVHAHLVVHVMSAVPTSSADLYAMSECWTEGAMSGNPGAASWSERTSGVAWQAAGAGVGSRATTPLATVQAMVSGEMIITELDAAGVATIQGWLQSSTTNCGFAIVTTGSPWSFRSKENTTQGQQAVLLLTLVP